MKNKTYSSLLMKRFLSALVLVILPLLAVSQTQAKRPDITRGKAKIATISLSDLSGIDVANSAELKARLAKLMARNPKAVKVFIKGTRCPAFAPQDLELAGFWGCLKGCLSEVGVSVYSAIMCGAACAAAGTGIGAVACAICVGVSVTAVEACALGCGIKGRIALEESMVRNTRPSRAPSRALEARLRLQPAKSKT